MPTTDSNQFCGSNVITCTIDLICPVIGFILFFIYLGDIQKKLNLTPAVLNIPNTSRTLLKKQALVIVPAIANFVGLFLILFHIFAAPYYCLIQLSLQGFLQLSIIGMQKKENDFLGYNSLSFRYFICSYMFIETMQIVVENSTEFQTTFQLVYYLLNISFIVLFYGYISLSYKNYDPLEMEKHLCDLLEQRISRQSFNRERKSRVVDKDEAFSQISGKGTTKHPSALKRQLLDKIKIDSSPDEQRRSREDSKKSPSSPQFVGTISYDNLDSAQKQDGTIKGDACQYSGFQVVGCSEQFAIKVFHISYINNQENRHTNRSFQEISMFVETVSRKYENTTVQLLTAIKFELENDHEKQDMVYINSIMQAIQQNEEICKEFGNFLEVKSAKIWSQHFTAHFKGRQIDSFAPKQQTFSTFNEKSNPESSERLQEISELRAENLQTELLPNQVFLQSIDFTDSQPTLVFLYCNRTGEQLSVQKPNIEFQRLASLIQKHSQLTSEEYETLSHYTNNVLEQLKNVLDLLLSRTQQKRKGNPQLIQCFSKLFKQ